MPRTIVAPNKGPKLAPPPDAFDKAKVIIKDPDAKPKYTLAILTHYIQGQAYHRYRLPVVDLCIGTMRDGIRDCELMIFDNGSTPDFKKKLKQVDADILVLSPNLGKQTAQQKMIELARGEIFCFSDDDIYYYPGWLAAHMEIIETIPDRPLLVSGSPQRTAFQWGMKSNLAYFRNNGIFETGPLIPEKVEREYARSISRSEYSHMLLLEQRQLKDYLVTFRGVKAWLHAHHMQFVARRKHLIGKIPPSKYLIDNAREWDIYMDNLGFLRLTTYHRTTLHIGNEIGGDVLVPGKMPQEVTYKGTDLVVK